MAWGRRCDAGCESWPDMRIYAKCPVCGEDAERFSNLRPLDEHEAGERVFELYYERRCEDRGVSVDGPLPENYEIYYESPGDEHRIEGILVRAESASRSRAKA